MAKVDGSHIASRLLLETTCNLVSFTFYILKLAVELLESNRGMLNHKIFWKDSSSYSDAGESTENKQINKNKIILNENCSFFKNCNTLIK